MRSLQGHATNAHSDDRRNRLAFVGIFAILAILLLSAMFAPMILTPRTGGSASATTTPHVSAVSRIAAVSPSSVAPRAASASPASTSSGGLTLSSFTDSPSVLMWGESSDLATVYAGATVIPATVNITYGAWPTQTYCPTTMLIVGDWCQTDNLTALTWTANLLNGAGAAWTGVQTIWVWVNATCNPTPTTWAPCAAAGSVTLTVNADPTITLAGAAHMVISGPFGYSLSFTNTFAAADEANQVNEQIVVASLATSPITGQQVEYQWQSPTDANLVLAPTLPATYAVKLSLTDLLLPAGLGNLPAGNYTVGVRATDANGTILTSEFTDGVSLLVTSATLSPAGAQTYVAGSTVDIAWAATYPTEDNNLTLSLVEPSGTVLGLGNQFQATGFSSGAIPLSLTVAGTYEIKLAIGTNGPLGYDPTAWGTATFWSMFNVTAVPPVVCPSPSTYNGQYCVENINWANTTYDNSTVGVSGITTNALGAILIVIGIIVGGVIGIMAGMMMARPKMPPTGGMDSGMGGTATTPSAPSSGSPPSGSDKEFS